MFNILVVEDDKDLNFTLTSCLKGNGFNVFSAYNGLDALNMFYENKISLTEKLTNSQIERDVIRKALLKKKEEIESFIESL